ncbi:MAG: serine protein kinase RIO, partial [Candidatus Woesearchaeota archaeon]
MALGREKWKVYGDVFDQFTLQNLHKLESQGFFTELQGSLSLGKEAHIFTATKKDGSLVIVKIYRLQNSFFHKMYSYIRTDPRFSHLKGKKRHIIFHWVKREFRNLLKARESGLDVPTPYICYQNIIVMQFIGNQKAAPQLKNAEVVDPESFFTQILNQVTLLYKEAKLVHGDLSDFNILCYEQKPIIIDMSQTTPVDDPNAEEYLRRDISNLQRIA